MTTAPRRPAAHLLVTVLTAALTLLLPAAPTAGAAVTAATHPPRPMVTGWLPYWTAAAATAAVTGHASLFSEASPFLYAATGATTVQLQTGDAARDQMMAALRAAGLRVVPAVTDGMPSGGMAAVLGNPTTRTAHVQTLVDLVQAQGYDGIDLDYETFAYRDARTTWPATRPAWVLFVQQLGAALHARGRLLAVTTPPVYDTARSATSGAWVYDWAGIASSVDRLRVMTYDYSVSRPGPIGPLPWTTKVAAFAVTQVPSTKVQIGVPLYGRDWVTATSGTCPTGTAAPPRSGATVYAKDAWPLAAAVKATVVWDATNAERTFSYRRTYTDGTAGCTQSRTVWFVDGSGADARARLVGRYLLRGVALWAPGFEDGATWSRLTAYAQSIAPYPSTATLVAPSSVTYGTPATLRVTVRAGGEPAAGATIWWWRRYRGQTTWRLLATTAAGSAGESSVTASLGQHTEFRATVAASWAWTWSSSAVRTTYVRLAVTATPSAGALPLSGVLRVTGTVRPVVAGRTVSLDRLQPAGYGSVGTTTVRSDGSYSLAVRLASRGTFTYRVSVVGDAYRSTGTSAAFTVTVG